MIFKIVFSIVILLLVLFVFIFIILKYKNKVKELKTYEIFTKPLISYIIVSYIFFVIGMAFTIANLFFSFIDNNIAYWATFGLGTFFNLISLILFFDLYLDVEAYKNKKIYVWRFFSKKIIDISEVEYILNFGIEVKFLNRRREKLFSSGSSINGTELIIEKIKQDHFVYDNLDETKSLEDIKNSIDEITIQKYEKFGRELRKNKHTSIRNFKRGYFLILFIILLGCLALIIFDSIVNIIYIIPFAFLGPIVYFIMLENYKKKYNLNDFELGYLHYKDCKSYVGHSKYVFKGIKINCLIWIAFGLIMGIPMAIISFTFKPGTYENLKMIQGTLEYSYVKETSKNNYIAFGIYEDDVEYRLSSFYADSFDLSFYENEQIGNEIVFYANDKVSSGNNEITSEKCDVCQIYYVMCNNIEYFSYQDFQDAEVDNNNVAKIASFVFLSITFVATTIMIVSYKVCKKNEKYEIDTV